MTKKQHEAMRERAIIIATDELRDAAIYDTPTDAGTSGKTGAKLHVSGWNRKERRKQQFSKKERKDGQK